ncbi:hypothetical protein [Caballeronia grimmiae]|uniref:hypothetical protein n=1 Tax=Caballeronia grimmiae TaxID=1071679 RepID=UPI0038BA084C
MRATMNLEFAYQRANKRGPCEKIRSAAVVLRARMVKAQYATHLEPGIGGGCVRAERPLERQPNGDANSPPVMLLELPGYGREPASLSAHRDVKCTSRRRRVATDHVTTFQTGSRAASSESQSHVVGAIDVSGMKPAEDSQVAKAGAAALA